MEQREHTAAETAGLLRFTSHQFFVWSRKESLCLADDRYFWRCLCRQEVARVYEFFHFQSKFECHVASANWIHSLFLRGNPWETLVSTVSSHKALRFFCVSKNIVVKRAKRLSQTNDQFLTTQIARENKTLISHA